jgi:hypothetical protein
MRKGSPLIWPTTVTVTFLPAVPTSGTTHEDRDEIVAAVRRAMEARRRADSISSAGPGA